MGNEPCLKSIYKRLIDYINAFSEFDNEINKIHNNIHSHEENYEGFLVNYKNYQ